MSTPGRILGIVLILGVAAGTWTVWRDHAGAPASKTSRPAVKAPVTVMTVQKTDFPVEIHGLGTVQPFNSVTVRSRVDGQIEKILVKQGQIVKKGDLLLQIDPRPYQAALAQATAKEQQDAANLANAQVVFQRDQQLIKQNYASRQQYDNDASTVRQLTALVAADKALVFNAQTQLSYTQIRAPISGRTSLRSIDVGNIVQASSSNGIMTIAQIQPIAVNFTAPEDELDRIYAANLKSPLKVAALSSDLSQTLETGKLEAINNAVDQATGTIALRAVFSNDDGKLWPGLSVATRMLVGTLHDVIVTPQDAVQHGPDGLFAYVIDAQDHAQVRPIAVGDSTDASVVITKGLTPGDRVVIAGQYRLQPDAPVTIAAAPSKTKVAEEQ